MPHLGVFARRLMVLLSLAVLSAATGRAAANAALLEAGRRIYAEGILPDGEPLTAIRPEGFTLHGQYAACIHCHRQSGMGSVEGNIDSTVLVPPVAGPVLFQAARFAASYLDEEHHYVPTAAWKRALTRPAYTQPSLAHALRNGEDPGGKPLLAPMPRYALDDVSVAALTAYLQQLSSRVSPGVEADTLHLATVVTPDAHPGQADDMLGVLQAWSRAARGGGRAWRLHVWKLTGPADSWPAQLQSRYRRQPVFALLSGLGGSQWTPVHDFCEQRRLPCLLPSVEVAPAVGDDNYSVYFSTGVDLEARLLAAWLSAERGVNIVQVYADASGRQAAETLRTRLPADDVTFTARRYRMTAPLAALGGLSRDDILVLWLRPAQIAQLLAELPGGPAAGRVFMSALLATPESLALPPAWKTRVHFVSLFDDLGLQGEIARLRLQRWLEYNGLQGNGNRRLQADAYAACYLFNEALAEIRDQEVRRPAVPLNREHLLETLETLVNKYNDSTDLVDPDGHVAYYGRLSLGPGQRIAVRGGSILRYMSSDTQRLVPAGKRIVP